MIRSVLSANHLHAGDLGEHTGRLFVGLVQDAQDVGEQVDDVQVEHQRCEDVLLAGDLVLSVRTANWTKRESIWLVHRAVSSCSRSNLETKNCQTPKSPDCSIGSIEIDHSPIDCVSITM